jgi:hypothetical protein
MQKKVVIIFLLLTTFLPVQAEEFGRARSLTPYTISWWSLPSPGALQKVMVFGVQLSSVSEKMPGWVNSKKEKVLLNPFRPGYKLAVFAYDDRSDKAILPSKVFTSPGMNPSLVWYFDIPQVAAGTVATFNVGVRQCKPVGKIETCDVFYLDSAEPLSLIWLFGLVPNIDFRDFSNHFGYIIN